MARNSVRIRSSSSNGARSCMVTTTDRTSFSAAWIGVTLTSVVTLRPSGTESVISSARTVSPSLSCRASGNSARETSRPSARRHVITSSSSSAARPGELRPSTMRRASRLDDSGLPVSASKTTTPTGDVSTRASRSARARRSSRWARVLASAVAAWEANSTRTSSSALVNSSPPSFSARKKLPTSTPRYFIGATSIAVGQMRSDESPSDRT